MAGDETPAPYEPRYCAFVDILGFSELIHNLGTGKTSAAELRSLLRTVHTPRGEQYAMFEGSDLKGQSISDALCLSAASSPTGLVHLFYSLKETVEELLERGFFVRGAVVKGDLYHDGTTVFGEALVRAYRIEQDVARYPRIIVASDVVKDANGFLAEKPAISRSLLQADDGPHYLHVLSYFEKFFNAQQEYPTDREEMRAKCNIIARHLQTRFNESVDNPKHFEKVQWFAKYWNRTLEPYASEVNQIIGPGVALDRTITWA